MMPKGLKLTKRSQDDSDRAAEALSKVELVITDCDGTLLYTDKTLGEPAKEAVRNLSAAGVRFTVASSRPGKGMRTIVDTLGIKTPFAAFNGGKLVDPAGWKTMNAHWLARDAAEIALESLARDGIDAWVFIDDQWYITNPAGEYVPLERRTVGYDAVVVKRFEDIDLGSVEKIVASTSNAVLLESKEAEFAGTLKGRATAMRSQSYYLDITHPLANKGEGIRELAKLAGVALENVAVLGDMQNDVAMFDVAGVSIVMGQASAQVQANATFVSSTNDEDGFAGGVNGLLAARKGEKVF
ncbi:Cof-type HAD-IIB family hydrolase [Caballeronia sordidicola]|uniref:Cof-like hydrolase family protein n=1 Tax=Caballeronia sordidicola TaxID=196367 RepID=A0A242MT12_CABSO|nr:Cof-type HAD-IIB family hydrolase [Caballeronia sordidicola]OTP74470.1 Cof-like hydrolase family protein [Caballeronia sordidicola]